MLSRKILYGLLALAVIFSVFPMLGLVSGNAEASSRYSDVSSSYWAAKEIEYLGQQGVSNGYPKEGLYKPEDPLKRSQAAVMITRALGESGLKRAPSFPDLREDMNALPRIERSIELGIFEGQNGRFNPNGEISKAQTAAIIARAFFGDGTKNYNGDISFSDVPEDHWARGYIAKLVDENIIERTSGKFESYKPATRAEFSAYLARAMNEDLRLDENSNSTPTPPDEDVSSEKLYEGVVVNNSTPLNVRKGPGTSYQVITTLERGEKVDVYSEEGNWLKVKVNGKEGYVSAYYIERADSGNVDEDVRPAEPIATKTVTTSSLVVRSGPGANHEAIGRLQRGDKVDIYEQTSGPWVLIKFNGKWAYTHNDYLGQTGLQGKTIVVDAGHGDHDPGTSGHDLVEKNVNLNVALRLEKLLKDAGVDVVMTRRDDTFVTLSGRVAIAEKANADAFISIHANAASAAAQGAETFYNSRYQARESRKLAEAIQKRLVAETGMRHRRVADANFYVIRNTTMPSTLVELGFLTNREDANRMKQPGYDDKAAKAIFNGINDYYSN